MLFDIKWCSWVAFYSQCLLSSSYNGFWSHQPSFYGQLGLFVQSAMVTKLEVACPQGQSFQLPRIDNYLHSFPCICPQFPFCLCFLSILLCDWMVASSGIKKCIQISQFRLLLCGLNQCLPFWRISKCHSMVSHSSDKTIVSKEAHVLYVIKLT